MIATHVLVLASLLVPLTMAHAQANGIVSESITITQRGNAKPDTILTRTTSTSSPGVTRTREDVSSSGVLPRPWSIVGTVMIVVQHDSSMIATCIDTAKKTYWPMDMHAVLASIMNTINTTTQSPQRGDEPTLDSIGDGEIIAGYKTVHFRSHAVIRMSMTMLGQPESWTSERTTDYYVAPGLPPDSLQARSRGTVSKAPVPTDTAMPGLKEFADQQHAIALRIAKVGATVKSVVKSVTAMDGGTRTELRTVQLIARRRAVVPDSVFAVPAGYTKTNPLLMGAQ